MAHMTEVKFGDYQLDERHRRLERVLKLAKLKKENNKERKQSLPISLPHTSDSSVASTNPNISLPIFCTPTIHHEIPSTKNLKNISPKGFKKQHDRKDFFTKQLQPPNSCTLFQTANKSNETSKHNAEASPVLQNNYVSPFAGLNKKNLKSELHNFSQQCTDIIGSSQINSYSVRSKKATVFTQWKVMLTEHGKLVIKGILQCSSEEITEKIIQSNPIAQRLTNTNVKSIFSDLYNLQGNIVDNEHELPDYVRNKFYNGFPEDWENVHKVWITFVQQGCRSSFCWPISITDSVVLNTTYLCSETPTRKTPNFKSFKKPHSPEVPLYSKYLFNIPQRKNCRTSTLCSGEKRNASTQTHNPDASESSLCNINVQTPINQYSYDVKSNEKQQYNKVKDKLNLNLNNLLDKKCPKKCMNEVTEIIDCLGDIIALRSNKNNDSSIKYFDYHKSEEVKRTSNETQKFKSMFLKKDVVDNRFVNNNTITHHYTTEEKYKILNHESTAGNELLTRKRTFVEMNRNNDHDDFDSDNEIYAGVPRIPVERLLQKTETLISRYKRKTKRSLYRKHIMSKRENLH